MCGGNPLYIKQVRQDPSVSKTLNLDKLTGLEELSLAQFAYEQWSPRAG